MSGINVYFGDHRVLAFWDVFRAIDPIREDWSAMTVKECRHYLIKEVSKLLSNGVVLYTEVPFNYREVEGYWIKGVKASPDDPVLREMDDEEILEVRLFHIVRILNWTTHLVESLQKVRFS